MLLRILVGMWGTRKIYKAVNKFRDDHDLKEYGKKVGYPFLPGEDIEKYRKKLMDLREGGIHPEDKQIQNFIPEQQ